jgi:predicted O-linked N-acetylglucosamine transferase (SPINDLY family)
MRQFIPAPSDSFQSAIACYRAGQLDDAERLCNAILDVSPSDFDALYLMANVHYRRRRPDAALASYDRVLSIRPNHAAALYNRGVVLQGAGRFAEALASYDRALAVSPELLGALINRGTILRDTGRGEEALASYDRALAIAPDHAAALSRRGDVLCQLDRPVEALASYDRAIAIAPGDAETLNARGLTLRRLRRFDEALASCERALAINPDLVTAHHNRGVILQDLRRFDDALASFDRVLSLHPDLAEALNNRATALRELHRPEAALSSCERALAIRPDYVEALNNRGLALGALRRFADALDSFDRALGIARDQKGAAADHRRALHYNRGVGLFKLGRYEAAIADFEAALIGDPPFRQLPGLLLHARMQCCDWRSFDDDVGRVLRDVRAGNCASGPFTLLAAAASAADQLAGARAWVADTCAAAATPVWNGERYRHDRIRVAYLSADFRDHPMGYLMAGVFERHDRARFEIFAISFGPDRPGAMRSRLSAAFDRWLDARSLSDREVAQQLRDREIDIAVDLMGHTVDARPRIFAHRPAPVQVNYLGYPGTSGADQIDYILADRFVIPAASRSFYSEQVVYLPDTFQGNDRSRLIAATPSRAAAGLPDDGFVFCSFNKNYKITPDLFEVWMRLLRAVDGSVLWLFAANEAVARNLRREAGARGVAPDRLIFAPRRPYAQYLAGYRLADLFLDTLPFNGGATASDALYAGLPLVTVAGEAFAARMAGSLLQAAGLPELVTFSLEDYEALALALARDPERLAAIRARLARDQASCPLFDTGRFTRHLESAYLTMWQRAERGMSPAGFSVDPQT